MIPRYRACPPQMLKADFGVGVWGDDFDPEEHKTVIEKAAAEGYQPTVDIFLPICNEPLCILANTWNHVAALDYPHVSVHVLDDGASDDVQNLAARYGFNCEFHGVPCLGGVGGVAIVFWPRIGGHFASDAVDHERPLCILCTLWTYIDLIRRTRKYLLHIRVDL